MSERHSRPQAPAQAPKSDDTHSDTHAKKATEKNSDRIQDDISQKIISIAARIAREEGAHQVSVRRITGELGCTNRVFYNRFANCDEVLRIVYSNAVIKMRDCVQADFSSRHSFYESLLDIAEQVLIQTYDVKMQFSRYMFEHDSLTENNRQWWAELIRRNYTGAKEHGWVQDVDLDSLTYTIWCFCRGFYVDAVMRRLPKEEAVRCLRFGFGCFLRGVMIPECPPSL